MRQCARCGQQRPIAAQHQRKIRMLGANLFSFHHLFAIDVLSGFLVEVDLVIPLTKPVEDFGQEFLPVRALQGLEMMAADFMDVGLKQLT